MLAAQGCWSCLPGVHMERIHDVVRDRELYSAQSGDSVLNVARYMVERNIGAVPVLRRGELIGIFSERDLMKRVVCERLDPATTLVDQVMSADPATVSPSESVENCMRLMRERGFRHLPVCEGSKLLGVISLRDLLLHDLVEKDGELQTIRAYLAQA